MIEPVALMGVAVVVYAALSKRLAGTALTAPIFFTTIGLEPRQLHRAAKARPLAAAPEAATAEG